MDDDDFEHLTELLADVQYCSSLSQWEQEFLDSLRNKIENFGVEYTISHKQQEIIDRIEKKVYAT